LSPRGTTFFGNRLRQRSRPTPITRHAKIDSDITERKHAERLLQTQHEFSGMLATGPDRKTLLAAILDCALRLPELDGGGLYWREPDGGYRLAVQRCGSAI
jgi:hypothetical protein